MHTRQLLRTLTGALSLLFFQASAQETWQKIMGGAFTDESNAVILTADGNLLIGGSSESFSQDEREGYLAKVSLAGNVLWEKTYNTGSFWNPVYDMVETPEGTFIATGKTWSNICPNGSNAYGFACDQQGNTLWMKGFCTPNLKLSDGYSVALGANETLVFGGSDLSAQSQNFTVFQTDKSGNVQWTKSLGTSGWEIATSAIPTHDGNIVAAGYINQAASPYRRDCYLVKLSAATGDTLWTFRKNTPALTETFVDLLELPDSTLMVAGYFESWPWLAHFDQNGHLLNEAILDQYPTALYYPSAIIRTSDGGYAITGSYTETQTSSSRDGYLAKVSADLTFQWLKTYGSTGEDYLEDLVATPDGGYCLAGLTKGFGDPTGDIWVIKTDADGNTSERIIRGDAYVDDNLNCQNESGETRMPGARLMVSGNNQNILRLTDANGQYVSLSTPGTYTVTASVEPPYWEFCNNPQTATVGSNTTEVVRDFGAQKTIDCPYISLDLSAPFLRYCSTNNRIYGQICNTGSVPAPHTQVRVTLDSFLIVDSMSVPYTALPDHVYLLETDSLGLFDCLEFKLYVQLSCTAPLGWLHCISGSATPDTLCHPDALPTFVSAPECIINAGSYDPNDKRGIPAGVGDEHRIAVDTEVKYQIRFQNTGTDTAFRVVVVDTLSAWLDPLSFRTGAHSHPYRLNWMPGNIVQFIFDPIALPDSNVNEIASHGFVNFYLRPRPNTPVGSLIPNTAAIYFDRNAPVLTNTWTYTIGLIASGAGEVLQPGALKAYPNPAQDYLVIETPEAYTGGVIRIDDVWGRAQGTMPVHSSQERLNLNLASGWYRVVVQKDNQAVLRAWIFVGGI